MSVCKSSLPRERKVHAYIAAVARPGITFSFVQASQATKPDTSAEKSLNASIQHAKENQLHNLKFVPMEMSPI